MSYVVGFSSLHQCIGCCPVGQEGNHLVLWVLCHSPCNLWGSVDWPQSDCVSRRSFLLHGGRKMDCGIIPFTIQLHFIFSGFSVVFLCSTVMNECMRVWFSYTEGRDDVTTFFPGTRCGLCTLSLWNELGTWLFVDYSLYYSTASFSNTALQLPYLWRPIYLCRKESWQSDGSFESTSWYWERSCFWLLSVRVCVSTDWLLAAPCRVPSWCSHPAVSFIFPAPCSKHCSASLHGRTCCVHTVPRLLGGVRCIIPANDRAL